MSKNTSTIEIINRETDFVSKFSKIPYASIVLESGSGVMLNDFDGKSYIDFLSSASSSNLGHGNPQILAAVIKQMEKLTNYTSAYFFTEPVGRLAEELALLAPGDIPKKVAFGLSGSDAIDGMIKLARGFTNRPKIISFIGSYHGSTLGAISLSAISTEMNSTAAYH